MLDLDSLAEKRARVLNQQEDSWRTAIWSAAFQKISQNMTDGEVESLVSLCTCVTHFDSVVRYLFERTQASGVAPFTVLQQEARSAGQSPEEWIKSRVGNGHDS